jgi:hypothetical protein
VAKAAHGTGTPVSEPVPEAGTTSSASAATLTDSADGVAPHDDIVGMTAVGDSSTTTGSMARASSSAPQKGVAANTLVANDDVEVVIGHPNLRAPGSVSLPKAMSTIFTALHRVGDVLHREWDTIKEEWLKLTEWGSLLKQWTTIKKEKAAVKRKLLNERQDLLDKVQVSIGLLDNKAHKLMANAELLYTDGEARADVTIK